MARTGNTREELLRLTQLLVVEGGKVMEAFASLHGLHVTDVEALTRMMVAEERGTAMTPGALAVELGLTSGAVTALVDRLERAGHMTRARDGADRRKVLLRYSPEGRALADEFFVPLSRRSHAAMDEFTPAELEVARRFLAAAGEGMAAHRLSLDPGAAVARSAKGAGHARPDVTTTADDA